MASSEQDRVVLPGPVEPVGGVRELATYTPGPWRVGSSWPGFANVMFSDEGRLAVLDRTRDGYAPFREAVEADARLMAAAPEMFEALLLLRSNPISNEAQKAMHAAIAKAVQS